MQEVKKNFEMPEAEIVMFEQEDVIVTSPESDNDGEWDIV